MTTKDHLPAFNRLVEIMALLRSEQGCPWDRQQTPESLKPHILEECYELLEAIDHGQPREICDELGDLLLQVVFQAQIFAEQDTFNIDDVAKAISSKLIRRHPHIFEQTETTEHEQRWEKIKLQERAERGQSLRLADRIPKTLPALKQAQKISKYLEIPKQSDIIVNSILQLRSLQDEATDNKQTDHLRRHLLGELLFSCARLARSFGIDAEDCLRNINDKYLATLDGKR